MSIENAILTHAAAVDKLADVMRALFGGVALAQPTARIPAVETIKDAAATADVVQEKAADLAEATGKRAAAAKKAQEQDAAANAVKPDAELEQAVQKVEQAAAAETEAPALDYNRDVKPVLLAAIKKAGKEKVSALIGSFGVEKADKVPADKLGELLAGAEKLAA